MPGPGGGPVGTALTILASGAEGLRAVFPRRVVSVQSGWLVGGDFLTSRALFLG